VSYASQLFSSKDAKEEKEYTLDIRPSSVIQTSNGHRERKEEAINKATTYEIFPNHTFMYEERMQYCSMNV